MPSKNLPQKRNDHYRPWNNIVNNKTDCSFIRRKSQQLKNVRVKGCIPGFLAELPDGKNAVPEYDKLDIVERNENKNDSPIKNKGRKIDAKYQNEME